MAAGNVPSARPSTTTRSNSTPRPIGTRPMRRPSPNRPTRPRPLSSSISRVRRNTASEGGFDAVEAGEPVERLFDPFGGATSWSGQASPADGRRREVVERERGPRPPCPPTSEVAAWASSSAASCSTKSRRSAAWCDLAFEGLDPGSRSVRMPFAPPAPPCVPRSAGRVVAATRRPRVRLPPGD